MPYSVGDTVVLDGIESVIIYDNGSEADWGRYICVDKNHDLVYYFEGTDFYNEYEYKGSGEDPHTVNVINTPAQYGYEWGFYNEQLPFASNSANHVIGKGLETTNVIISNKDTTNTKTGDWYLLWDKVVEFRQLYSDKWFVPSNQEISLVYNNKQYLTNLTEDSSHFDQYWCSSETGSSTLYSLNMSNGFSGGASFKDYHNKRVRLCRYTTDQELNSKTIQITSTTDQASIYYTIDNSTPTSNPNLYSNTFQVQTGTTIKAIGIKEGYIDSDIATLTV